MEESSTASPNGDVRFSTTRRGHESKQVSLEHHTADHRVWLDEIAVVDRKVHLTESSQIASSSSLS